MWLTWLLISLFFAPTKTNKTGTDNKCSTTFCYRAKCVSEADRFHDTEKMETNFANGSLEIISSKHSSSHSTFKKMDVVTMVADMAWQTLDQSKRKCHNVLLTTNMECPLVSRLIRSDYIPIDGFIMVDIKKLSNKKETEFLQRFWGASTTSCRSLLIDMTCVTDPYLYRILEASKLWHWSNVRIVFVGSLRDVQSTLLEYALRNVPRPVYIAIEDDLLWQIANSCGHNSMIGEDSEPKVGVFGRCLYCEDGNPKVKLLAFWTLGSTVPKDFNPFPDQENNLQGHIIRVTTFPVFPYGMLDKTAKNQDPSIVTFADCLDGRVLNAVSATLNFSYEVRKATTTGISLSNGTWIGMVGMLHREQADVTTMLALNSERILVMDFASAYVSEVLAIVSLKPKVLPRYLVIVRPFTVDVWIYLLLIVILWGVTLWLFQNIWSRFSQGKAMTIGEGIFYSLAVILEDPPIKKPTNISGQMLLGFWLATCLITSTMYKAELIANLAVERRESPIDDFEDMIARDSWRCGMVAFYFKAYPIVFLRNSPHPVIKEVYKRVESVADFKEGLGKVAKGGFSFMNVLYQVEAEIRSYHTDHKGWTPFHISKRGEKIFADLGLALRKGLPSGNRIKYYINRLIEAGLIEFWTDDLMASGIAESPETKKIRKTNLQMYKEGGEEEHEGFSGSLRLSHVMGVFLCLSVGLTASFVILISEIIKHKLDHT